MLCEIGHYNCKALRVELNRRVCNCIIKLYLKSGCGGVWKFCSILCNLHMSNCAPESFQTLSGRLSDACQVRSDTCHVKLHCQVIWHLSRLLTRLSDSKKTGPNSDVMLFNNNDVILQSGAGRGSKKGKKFRSYLMYGPLDATVRCELVSFQTVLLYFHPH